jgi:hypothetical protein
MKIIRAKLENKKKTKKRINEKLIERKRTKTREKIK